MRKERHKSNTSIQDLRLFGRKEIVKTTSPLTAAALLALSLGALPANADKSVSLLPGGIVYPEYNSAAVLNPGTLNKDDARLTRILLEPNIFGSSTQAAGLDSTFTKPNWGVSAGYAAARTVYTGLPASAWNHSVHGGIGFALQALGIGLGYTHNLTSSTSGSGILDLGLAYTMGKARLALVVEGLSSTPSTSLGIGVQEKDTYAIEFNLGLPSFTAGFTAPGSTYNALLAMSLYLKPFGVGYTTNYSYAIAGGTGTVGTTSSSFLTSPLGFSHGFSLLLAITDTGTISFRFDSNDYLILGLTFCI